MLDKQNIFRIFELKQKNRSVSFYVLLFCPKPTKKIRLKYTPRINLVNFSHSRQEMDNQMGPKNKLDVYFLCQDIKPDVSEKLQRNTAVHDRPGAYVLN